MTAPEKLTLKEVHDEVVYLTQRFDKMLANMKWGFMALISILTLIVLYTNGHK